MLVVDKSKNYSGLFFQEIVLILGLHSEPQSAKLKTTLDMPTFEASRISGNDNVVFPDRLEIDAVNVTYYKGTVLGYRSIVIARANIASVYIGSGLIFADVVIETTGGRQIRASGFRKRDARAIVALLT